MHAHIDVHYTVGLHSPASMCAYVPYYKILDCVLSHFQVSSSLRCHTEAVIRGIGDAVRLMTRLERECRRHLTKKKKKQMLHRLRDVELLRRSTHCYIYNTLGGDTAPPQCRAGSHHTNHHHYSIARRHNLGYLGRHRCGLWQCKIADDLLSSLKRLVELLDDKRYSN